MPLSRLMVVTVPDTMCDFLIQDIIYGDYLALMHHMIKERKVICCLILVKARDGSHRPYARLSGQIYNTMDDYKRFGEEILKLTKEQV